MSSDPGLYPGLSELRLNFPGSWTGELALTAEHQVAVTYVCHPEPKPLREVTDVLQSTVALVCQNEWSYRLKAAQAWLPRFHEEAAFARAWNDEELARSFVLRGIVLGSNDSKVILGYASPTDKELSTWFNADGTVSHISGDLFE